MAVGGAPAGSLVLLPLTAGVLAGGAIVADAHPATWLAGAIAAGALAAAAVVADRRLRVVIVALLCGGTIGGGRSLLDAAPLSSDHIARRAGRAPVAVEGTVIASSRAGAALRLTVRAARYRSAAGRGRACGDVGVTIAHPTRDWAAGTRLRIVGRLRRPRDFGNPGGYDVRRALARRGIYVTMFLWNERDVEPIDAPPRAVAAIVAADVGAALASARRCIGAAVDGSAAEPARGFLRAVLIGEDGALADDTRRALARTGLSHVVSVSGFHLAVVGAAAIVGMRWLLVRAEWLALSWNVGKLAAFAGLPPVFLYAALAGGSIPASRSLLMYATLVTALLANRRADGLRSLAAAALVLGLWVPDVAGDISFELSFASVAALIVTAVPASRGAPGAAPTWRGRIGRLLAASLRVSCAAAAATAPLTAWHFQQVSLIAPVANLLALPLLGPATLLPGLAALPLVPLAPLLAGVLLRVAAIAAGAGLWIATLLAAVPGAALATPMPTLAEVAVSYAILALPLAWGRLGPRARRAVAVILVVLAVADVGYWTWERLLNPRLRITFLAVGQGDAAVVELPRGGGTVVIDGGGLPGGFDTGERLIAPFLRSRKILRVDALALSHPQLDHYGGLAYLAEHFAPREFWSNGTTAAAPGFARLVRALAAAETRRVVLRRGMRALERAGARIDVLHPVAPDGEDLNDGSLVLRVAYGAASVLFTGDLERPGELEMLGRGSSGGDAAFAASGVSVPSEIASVVLKVPHHGSATSSSVPLLAAVAPNLAVISAGAENRFGFPAAAVLRRLAAGGADVWRTDEDGAVRLVSDGIRLVVSAPRGTRPSRVLTLTRDTTPARFEFPTSLW
jgi:competence protein ComEC